MAKKNRDDKSRIRYDGAAEWEREIILGLHRLMNQPARDRTDYFCITLLGDMAGEISIGVQTSWRGYTDTSPRREVREGRLFHGESQREYLSKQLNQPALLVNDDDDFSLWYSFGGHGVIAEDIGRKYLAKWLTPCEVGRVASSWGFVSSDTGLKDRSPSRKLRMRVLNRDGRRCAICGRSAASSVDVELHVHHVVPWKDGGITDERNLITLCGACHGGLDPHYDLDLESTVKNLYRQAENEYYNGIANYQIAMARTFQKFLTRQSGN